MSRDDAPSDELDPEERWGDPEDRWGDPEERWGDSEADLVEIPTVDVPDTAGEGDLDVDGDLATTFWVTVVLVNVAVAGVSIGAMLVYFRGDTLLGGGAAAVGVVALVRAYDRYRDFRAGEDEDGADDNKDGGNDDESGDVDGNGDVDEPTADDADGRQFGDSGPESSGE